ncbi:metallopeptidase TldD-related protein [Pseudobacillus badius]|uniref:metallopeptidase TldD-related protein n=1 Tax=Bacillus badius TaxID=1455 RepID=UPI003CF8E99C
MKNNVINELKELQKRNQQVESTFIEHETYSVSWSKNSILSEDKTKKNGYIVRLVNDYKEVGNGYSSGHAEALKQAYNLADSSTNRIPLEKFILTQENISEKPYSPATTNKELTKKLLFELLDIFKDVDPLSISAVWNKDTREYGNTFEIGGVSQKEYFTCTVIFGGTREVKSYLGRDIEWLLNEIEIPKSVHAKEVRESEVHPFTGSVIFEPLPFSFILSYIGSWLSVYGTEKGKLENKLYTKIAPDFVNLTDCPTSYHPFPIADFDMEGIVPKNNSIIEKGYLQNLFYDRISACLRNTIANGNSQYSDINLPPRVSPNILSLTPGNVDKNSMINRVKKGFLVKEIKQFSGGLDFHSGNYNFLVVGNPIESGELVNKNVKTLIRGNIIHTLRDIEMLGNDPQRVTFLGRVICPSVAVNGVHVGGY